MKTDAINAIDGCGCLTIVGLLATVCVILPWVGIFGGLIVLYGVPRACELVVQYILGL